MKRDRIGKREERDIKRDRERKRKKKYTDTVGDRRYIKKESFTHKKWFICGLNKYLIRGKQFKIRGSLRIRD